MSPELLPTSSVDGRRFVDVTIVIAEPVGIVDRHVEMVALVDLIGGAVDVGSRDDAASFRLSCQRALRIDTSFRRRVA